MTDNVIRELTRKRQDLCARLEKALDPFHKEVVIAVITGWMSVDRLEQMTKHLEEARK